MKIKKRREERKKLEKKQIILITTILSLIVVAGSTFAIFKYIDYKKEQERQLLISDIKKAYNKYIITNKKTNIYDKNLKKVGTIKKGMSLEVIKSKKEDFAYYQLANTPYYINYKDVNKIKELDTDLKYKNYITLNKNAITKNKVNLYQNAQLAITLDKKIEAPIKFIDNDYYYIDYLNHIFSIKKDEISTVKDYENSTLEEANYISIINYNTLATQCNTSDCILLSSIEEQIDYLNKNGYYGITFDEYKNWLNSNIRLMPKAILLTTPNETTEVKTLNEKYNNIINIINSNNEVKFVDDNHKTTKDSKLNSLSRYNIKKDTKIDTFVKMVLGETIPIVVPNNTSDQPKVAVINYHFFYDGNTEACNENICLDISNFRQQLDYLRDNNFKTLTMEEFRAWMYGEIDVPPKSVLLTVDDGAFGTGKHNGNKLIPILEEYNMHATLFLITGWWDINNYRSPNLDIQSHTYDMHNTGPCGKAQMICAGHDELMTDLKKSIDIIGNNTAFCFPFYTYDDEAIQAVQQSGFKLAFIGGNRKATRNDNKFKIPRYPIYKSTTLERFISIVN